MYTQKSATVRQEASIALSPVPTSTKIFSSSPESAPRFNQGRRSVRSLAALKTRYTNNKTPSALKHSFSASFCQRIATGPRGRTVTFLKHDFVLLKPHSCQQALFPTPDLRIYEGEIFVYKIYELGT